MQIEIERFDLRIDRVDLRGWSAPGLGGPRRYGERCSREREEKQQETFHIFHVKVCGDGIRPQTARRALPGGKATLVLDRTIRDNPRQSAGAHLRIGFARQYETN